MGATVLSIYNKALRSLEERKCASISEAREPIRYLTDEYSDAVEYCLRDGYWTFSIRNIQSNASTTLTPNFGFQFVFPKPTDWVRTYQIADNDGYMPLLRRFDDEAGNWFADITPIYAKYVSNDENFGMNMAMWTPGFVEYLAVYLAWLCAPRLKQATDKVERLEKLANRMRIKAMASDAMDLAVGERKYDTWVMSRAPRGSILPLGTPFGGLLD